MVCGEMAETKSPIWMRMLLIFCMKLLLLQRLYPSRLKKEIFSI